MKYTANQISAMFAILIIILLLGVFLFVKSPASEMTIGVVIGLLGGELKQAAGFLWGSTSGSQAKDIASADLQSKMVESLAESTPVIEEKKVIS